VQANGSAPQPDRSIGLRTAIGAVLFGGAFLVTLHDWLGIGGSNLDDFVGGPLYDAVVIGAAFACLIRAGRGGREREAWLALSAAILSWGASEVYWTLFLAHNASPPYPSPADVGYLAFYPLAAFGVYLLVKARAHELDWRLWMDGLIAGLGTAALGAAFVFEFVAHHATGTSVQIATTLAYPLGDVLMLALVVGVVALTRWKPGRTWSLLLGGLAALVVADVAYTLQSTGASLPEGNWVDPIYLIAAAFLGAEAWQPSAESIRSGARFDGWRELMVPGFFAMVMIGLFAMQYFNTVSGLTTALISATMIAVIVRLAISVTENKRLLEQVQTDALTGLGSQGRMRIDLEASCQLAGEQPFTLLLFDLNGFKRYNDTFGHPAGDTILSELGAKLKAAVATSGFSYRLGGDEFAVLLTCEEGQREAVTKKAAEALTARGRGFELSASWGAAKVPEEAVAPTDVLRLADVRMYAQKESRRLSHHEEIEIDAATLTLRSEGSRDREALEHRD
jgi:diguanylate cyclase (GGDEF)-like protein